MKHGGLKILLVLNLFDAIFTLLWVRLGFAIELNPLLSFVADSSVLFVLVKIMLVCLGVLLLKKYISKNLLARFLLGTSLILYFGVVTYHLWFWCSLLFFYLF